MDRKTAENIVADHSDLVAKAMQIINAEGPPWGSVPDNGWVRVDFEGDEVVVTSPRATMDYDCPVIETEEARFPAALLFMSEVELKAWREQARQEYEQQRERAQAERRAQHEAVLRAQYESLKAKFEPSRCCGAADSAAASEAEGRRFESSQHRQETTMNDFQFRAVENGSPIKMWTHGVQVEDQAMQQLRNVAMLPFVHKHVAAMPDVHWGMGATVGSVIATRGAIVPAAVGVDIGCGMMACKTTLSASDLPDNLHQTRLDIEAAVPHGRTDNGGANDRGAWGDIPDAALDRWRPLESRYEAIIAKHPKAKGYNSARHIGTLGTGNHFIEICLDENDAVWVMLHSGSRGAGNKIGQYFIQKAKDEMARYYVDRYLPDADLSYLVEHTELFDDYVNAVGWAQDFAMANREAMMRAVLLAMGKTLPAFGTTEMAVNCHHNYVARENHFGANVLVTRKGAVRARQGDLGIIPGSMGTGSFIVRGKGNAESFCSCSHGAGRAMSRGAAKKSITLEQHAEAMKGIEARLDADVLDESPAAYKPIGAVMAAQGSLVEIVHRLRQVVNVKG